MEKSAKNRDGSLGWVRDERLKKWDERLNVWDGKKQVGMRKLKVGMRDWNFGMRKKQFGMETKHDGMRDWNFGMRRKQFGMEKLLERHSTPFNVDKNIESKRASTLNSLRVEPQNWNPCFVFHRNAERACFYVQKSVLKLRRACNSKLTLWHSAMGSTLLWARRN